MGFFNRKKAQIVEERADITVDDVLLSALVGSSSTTKESALNIPTVRGGIDYIANTVSMLPIKLYEELDGKVKEIKNDPRIRILNDDTGDTLDAVQFWRAIIEDYFLGKGGYAYINKQRNTVTSLHYVREEAISIVKNTDEIFKDYDIYVNADHYKPFDFIKILRNTKDGCKGKSIIEENPLIISVLYNTLKFEDDLVAKGGNKKGFIKSVGKLTQDVMDALKAAWRKLYSNNNDNVIILNNGLEFQEASNTSVEMQLNENKQTNSLEISKILRVPETIIKGNATEQDYLNGFKSAVLPVIRAIECALNRDYLLENEKNTKYWAFDTKEITKGDIKARYEAYKVAIDANFMQPDEARYLEDMEPLGLDFIKLSLDSVLYNPNTKEIYTPNTGLTQDMNNLKDDKTEKGDENIEHRD